MSTFYGMPWEIFRTDNILPSSSWPITFVTKSGRVPGYYSLIVLLPEYDLGITILVAGEDDLFHDLRELVTVELVKAVDEVTMRQISEDYAGTYVSADTKLNSSITLAISIPDEKSDSLPNQHFRGLVVQRFISNDTDVLRANLPGLSPGQSDFNTRWHIQLAPTGQYHNASVLGGSSTAENATKSSTGEVWRAIAISDEPKTKIWDDFCMTDVDLDAYAGLPINEFVFWRKNGNIAEVELPAFRVKLKRSGDDGDKQAARVKSKGRWEL